MMAGPKIVNFSRHSLSKLICSFGLIFGSELRGLDKDKLRKVTIPNILSTVTTPINAYV